MLKGKIHSIESFGTVDGPGIRFVVFFQGCPMRCKFCHNPDTWSFSAGKEYQVDELLEEFESKREFYKNGGITATGGEPLAQLPFLIELFSEAKKRGIHTCLDTSGIYFQEKKIEEYKELAKVCDYVMLDIKHVRNEEHKELCAQENTAVFAFLRFLEEESVAVRIRHVLVPDITLVEDELKELGAKMAAFSNIKELEVLPYHTLGLSKYKSLNIPYPLEGVEDVTKEEAAWARNIIMEAMKDATLANMTKKK